MHIPLNWQTISSCLLHVHDCMRVSVNSSASIHVQGCMKHACMARYERLISNREVLGSIPSWVLEFFQGLSFSHP